MTIKRWFLMKNFDTDERIAIGATEPEIVKETEKALYLKWKTDYGNLTKWVPKSCIEDNTLNADSTEITKATTKDGRTLDVVSDDGLFVELSDGKKYAKFMLAF